MPPQITIIGGGSYRWAPMLAIDIANTALDCSLVTGFHMDEHLGLPADQPAGFGRYTREHVVVPLHPAEFHVIRGDVSDVDAECARFDDPADVKVVELDDVCRCQQVGEGHFPDVDAVPTHALTVTIPALPHAARVFAVVPESWKTDRDSAELLASAR